MHKEIGTVYLTDELSMFKSLEANRDVKESRKQILISSIDKNGFIPVPIVVNEKYEVIDGQGRLAACKELGKEIAYTIVGGTGIKECRTLNANAKTWTMHDYIASYAAQGSKDYQRLLSLSDMGFGIRTYMFANNLYGGSAHSDQTIKEGRAKSSEKCYESARAALEYLRNVKPYTDKIIGRKADFESAVLFAYSDNKCNVRRLTDAISTYYSNVENIIGLESAMDELSKIYNRNLKGEKHLYLKEDYDRFKH